MEVYLTGQFEQAYEKLTVAEQKGVRKALNLLSNNLRHPGLHVKKMEGRHNIWEACPSRKLRMTFEVMGEAIVMRNVGEHDKVLRKP